MRVAIVTESFLPQVNGVSNSVLRILEHLRAHGHQALVVAPGAGADQHRGTPVVRVPAVDLPRFSSLPVGVPTRRVLTALADFRPDVVHLASPFVMGARGLSAARRLGTPTVAVYQTDVAGFAGNYGLGLTKRAAWRWTKRLHTLADRTLAPSSSAVEALERHGVPRVHRWGRGVDVDLFHPRSKQNDELTIGYVGRLAPEKQVHRLKELHDLPGVRLRIVGDGPDREQLERDLPNAEFLGFRTGQALAEAYASLDVFIHTGPHETFCQAVQEALATGLPVLAPNAGGPRDLVAHGRTGYLFEDDIAQYADLLRDPLRRRRFGLAARKSVLSRTWSAVCDELMGHYAAVIGLTHRAAA
ncbi:glycosyltransferase family 1 protein [Lentzea sp.]|uniref:glycosyltransferase family 4 protein n=1 Tax=Lentzea sp. TaxID=56099 RepID=UPI002C4253AB|nr:glycosyltransferase family 1 protein [Lentzea sp.]HUQ55081.1 glycosyltransferase family 1 protein [Lentzea sp.]